MFDTLVPTEELEHVEFTDNYVVGTMRATAARLPYLRYGCLIGKFAGLNTLFDYQDKLQQIPKRGKESDARLTSYDRGFYYFKNFKEAVDTYRYDPSSIAEFQELDDYLDGGDVAGKAIEYDVQGDFLDVGRFLEDNPECFGYMTNGNPRNRRLAITVDLSWWWRIENKVIIERSKRILRLIDWLESQGVRTAVVGISSQECSHLEVALKHFDEPLSITDLAVMGHSDFLRRVIFRFDEYSETWQRDYGSSDALKRNFSPTESPYNNEYVLHIGSSQSSSMDMVTASFNNVESKLTDILTGEDTETRVMSVL